MSIIEAKCPNCGAPMSIDTAKDACYCEYCNTHFVTEKIINASGDYINGNKIINNTKQDNEWSYKKLEKITDFLSGNDVTDQKEKSLRFLIFVVILIFFMGIVMKIF